MVHLETIHNDKGIPKLKVRKDRVDSAKLPGICVSTIGFVVLVIGTALIALSTQHGYHDKVSIKVVGSLLFILGCSLASGGFIYKYYVHHKKKQLLAEKYDPDLSNFDDVMSIGSSLGSSVSSSRPLTAQTRTGRRKSSSATQARVPSRGRQNRQLDKTRYKNRPTSGKNQPKLASSHTREHESNKPLPLTFEVDDGPSTSSTFDDNFSLTISTPRPIGDNDEDDIEIVEESPRPNIAQISSNKLDVLSGKAIIKNGHVVKRSKSSANKQRNNKNNKKSAQDVEHNAIPKIAVSHVDSHNDSEELLGHSLNSSGGSSVNVELFRTSSISKKNSPEQGLGELNNAYQPDETQTAHHASFPDGNDPTGHEKDHNSGLSDHIKSHGKARSRGRTTPRSVSPQKQETESNNATFNDKPASDIISSFEIPTGIK